MFSIPLYFFLFFFLILFPSQFFLIFLSILYSTTYLKIIDKLISKNQKVFFFGFDCLLPTIRWIHEFLRQLFYQLFILRVAVCSFFWGLKLVLFFSKDNHNSNSRFMFKRCNNIQNKATFFFYFSEKKRNWFIFTMGFTLEVSFGPQKRHCQSKNGQPVQFWYNILL